MRPLNDEIYHRLFNLGCFASSWPESINSKIFENHIDSFDIKLSQMRESIEKANKVSKKNQDVSFFIRSYRGDFCWLNNVISSIEKFAEDCPIIICIEECDFEYLPKITNKNLKVVKEEKFCDGTIQQKYSKLTADFYCDTEYIIYLDSDSALVRPFNIKDWLYFDKPILEYTSYEDINKWFIENNIRGGNPEIWRKGVSRAVGYDVTNEFSRRLEKIYKTSWLKGMRQNIENVNGIDFKNFMSRQRGIEKIEDCENTVYFSDFNYMGAYLWKYQRADIAWINTSILDYWTRKVCAVQFHSYTMTKTENEVKKVNEIPLKFMEKVYNFWKSSPDQADDLIFEEYNNLRKEYRY